jgi:hypothetical protein
VNLALLSRPSDRLALGDLDREGLEIVEPVTQLLRINAHLNSTAISPDNADPGAVDLGFARALLEIVQGLADLAQPLDAHEITANELGLSEGTGVR